MKNYGLIRLAMQPDISHAHKDSPFRLNSAGKQSMISIQIKKILTVLLLSGSLVSYNSNSDTAIHATLGYGHVDGFIDTNNSGVGYTILKEIVLRLKQNNIHIETRYLPFKRVLRNFIAGTLDIAYPIINGGTFENSGYAMWGFEKMPLHSTSLYNGGGIAIYTLASQPILNSLDSLIGKVVGIPSGAYVPRALKSAQRISVVEVAGMQQLFKMLERGRLDAIVAQKAWASAALGDKNSLKQSHHGVDLEIIIGSSIFQLDQKGANLLAAFNRAIAQIILDGTYEEILSQYPDSNTVFRY